ncbi:MAG: SIS domain-containing protein [Firmicutes bacterium]|nr:SIS domain-containing protein [Bacillota bacterium]
MGDMRPYFESIVESIKAFPLEEIDRAIEALYDAYKRRAQIFTLGNGGSAATAIHLAGDLNKTTITDLEAPRFRARALSENISQITAWANDLAYQEVFRQQLMNFLEPKDLIFAISGSGNSPNVLKAVEYGKGHGALVIGLSGFAGGKLGDLAHIPIVCRNTEMLQVEDLHSIVCHYITWELRAKLRP